MADFLVWRKKGDQFLDGNGDPYSGGKLYYYDSGTTSDRTVYSDKGVTAHSQPIILDSSGRLAGSVYVPIGDFKEQFDTSADVNVFTGDAIQGAIDTSGFTATFSLLSSPVTTKAANYTIVAGDAGDLFAGNATGGNFTLTLPTAAAMGAGKGVFVENVGATGIVTIGTVGGETITSGKSTSTTLALSGQGYFVMLVSDGANWFGGLSQASPFLSPVLTTPQINDTSSDHQYIFSVSELAADRTVTLPLLTGNDEFVFRNAVQTLTNKTLTTSTTLTSPTITTPVINTSISGTAFLDEDTLVSDSATKVASQQSIKAYADAFFSTGTWTPALKFGGNQVSMVESLETGTWHRAGNLFSAVVQITLTAKGSSSGDATISLPTVTGYTLTSHQLLGVVHQMTDGGSITSQIVGRNTSTTLMALFDISSTVHTAATEGNFGDATVFKMVITGFVT